MAQDLLRLIRTRTAGITGDQDEIQQLMQTLLREHLRDVVDANPLPLPDEPMTLETCQIMAQVTSVALRQDGDVLPAELLDVTLRSLEKILLALSKRRWFDFKEPPASPSTPLVTSPTAAAPEPSITLYTRNGDTKSWLLREILPTFWGNPPDNHCDDCRQPIIGEPPMRTIARVNPGPAALGTHVRVTSRHFACLKASGVLWVPVSHVWHVSIRRANESKAHDDEAAHTLLRALSRLLDASVDAYGPDVEFWHDYFSVPQWVDSVKESLLCRIPPIYHDAQEILVQMSDLPGSYIMTILSLGSAEFSASMALRVMPVLQGLCASQWMERMWVLLEYSFSRGACVMDQSDYIWRVPAGRIGMERDTFTTLVHNGHNILLGLFRHANAFAKSLKDGFLAGLTDKQEDDQRSLCLGEAVELVARTQCHLFRDRFFAVHMLKNKNSPPSLPAIPRAATEACRWVWQAALVGGDFSPLLLQPRESQQESDPGIGLPSWLPGYSGLDRVEWGLGNQKAPPRFRICVDNEVIKTELDVVGKIQRIHYLDVEESGEVAGVEWTIELLSSLAETGTGTRRLSAAELVDGLNRIFPFDDNHTRFAQHLAGLVYTLEGRQSQDPSFAPKLERYLAEFFAAPSRTSQRRYAAQKITQLMRYESSIMGNMTTEVTRLTRSRHIARSRRQRGATDGEPICEVRCVESGCRALTALRLDLRATARLGDTVYRVPGLSYSDTVEDGVGLGLNQEGRITGRMLYGASSCPCQLRQTVEIR